MKKCSIHIFRTKIYTVSMIETDDGWVFFVPPITFAGEIDSISNENLGLSTKAAVNSFRTGASGDEALPEKLDEAVRKFGFKSSRKFFRDCLEMSVEEAPGGYSLQPYERLKKRGEEGAIPLDITLSSSDAPEDLGRAVRECISYCR